MSDGDGETQGAEALLDYIRQSRAVDFTAYKRSTLLRRIAKRMQQVNLGSFADYQDYLEVHPEEFAKLFDTVLINVTSFFRDPEAWEALGGEIVPAILAAMGDREPIRIWSGGCSSGEEAFTLAMVWAESLGAEAFHQRVKIYATDVDDDALAKGRQATYEVKQLEPVPEDLRRRYFERSGDRYAFSGDLRRSDLPPGPPRLPQHLDLPQRRDPGPHPGQLSLRAQPPGVSVPRQGGDAPHPRHPVPCRRPEAPPLLQDRAGRPPRPPA